MSRIPPSVLLAFAVLFPAAPAWADPAADAAKLDSQAKELAGFVAAVPAPSALWQWRDQVETRLQALPLPEDRKKAIAPLYAGLDAAVRDFDPRLGPEALIRVQQAARRLAQALSPSAQGPPDMAERLRSNPRLALFASQLEAIKGKDGSGSDPEAGRKLALLYDNMRAAGLSPELLQERSADDSSQGPAGKETGKTALKPKPGADEVPLLERLASGHADSAALLTGEAVGLEAAKTVAFSAGMDPLARHLEELAFQARLQSAERERSQTAYALLGAACDQGQDQAACDLQRQRSEILKEADPAARERKLAAWLERADAALAASDSVDLKTYFSLQRQLFDKSRAAGDLGSLRQRLAEFLRDHQDIADYVRAKGAAAAVEERGAQAGLGREGLPVPKVPGSRLAETLAGKLAGLAAAAGQPELASEAGRKCWEDIAKQTKDFRKEFIGGYAYLFADSADRLLAEAAEADRAKLKPFVEELRILDAALKELREAVKLEEVDALVRLLAKRLELAPEQTNEALLAYRKRMLERHYSDYALKEHPERAAALAAVKIAVWQAQLDKIRSSLADRLEGPVSKYELSKIFDGVGKELAGLEAADPRGFYALLGDMAKTRGMMSRYDVDERHMKPFDEALARSVGKLGERPAPGQPEDPRLRQAKLAFYAALSELPLTASLAGQAFAGLKKDLAMEELLGRAAQLAAGLPAEEQARLAARKAAALGESDPVKREQLLQGYVAEARKALEGAPPYSGRAQLAAQWDANEAAFKASLAQLTQKQRGSPMVKEIEEALRRECAGGKPVSQERLAELVAAAQEKRRDDPSMKELAALISGHTQSQTALAQRMTKFGADNAGYMRWLDSLDRYNASALDYLASGQAPKGARFTLTGPDGETIIAEDAAAQDLGGAALKLAVRGGKSVSHTGLDVPRLVGRMTVAAPDATDEERRDGKELRGYRVARPDGSEEFRSYDGRLVVVTVKSGDRVRRTFFVDGLPAGAAEQIPDPKQPGETLARVTSVVPGHEHIQEVATTGMEFSSHPPADVRLDDILALKDPAQRDAALRQRVDELADFLEQPYYEGYLGHAVEKLDRDLMFKFLQSQLAQGARSGDKAFLRLRKSWGSSGGGFTFIDEDRGGGKTIYETGFHPGTSKFNIYVAEAAPDGRGRKAWHYELDRSGGGWEERETLPNYVEKDGWWKTQWGDQPRTYVYAVSADGSRGREPLRQELGVFTPDREADTLLLSSFKSAGKGVVGFGETIWYGAVGTGKLIVGGGIEVFSLGYAEDAARMYAVEGAANFGQNPLSRAIYGEDLDQRIYQGMNEKSRRILRQAEIGEGDPMLAFRRASDPAGNLYRWGGQAENSWARAGLYTAGALMDFGEGTAKSLPLMFAGQYGAMTMRTLGASNATAALVGTWVNRGVSASFLYMAGSALKELPGQLDKFDWNNADSVRALNGNISNIVFMVAAAKATKGTGLELGKGKFGGLFEKNQFVDLAGKGKPRALPKETAAAPGTKPGALPDEVGIPELPENRPVTAAELDTAFKDLRQLVVEGKVKEGAPIPEGTPALEVLRRREADVARAVLDNIDVQLQDPALPTAQRVRLGTMAAEIANGRFQVRFERYPGEVPAGAGAVARGTELIFKLQSAKVEPGALAPIGLHEAVHSGHFKGSPGLDATLPKGEGWTPIKSLISEKLAHDAQIPAMEAFLRERGFDPAKPLDYAAITQKLGKETAGFVKAVMRFKEYAGEGKSGWDYFTSAEDGGLYYERFGIDKADSPAAARGKKLAGLQEAKDTLRKKLSELDPEAARKAYDRLEARIFAERDPLVQARLRAEQQALMENVCEKPLYEKALGDLERTMARLREEQSAAELAAGGKGPAGKTAAEADAWNEPGAKPLKAALILLDDRVDTDMRTFALHMENGVGLKKGFKVLPEKGEFYRGVGKEELGRIVEQEGLIPKCYQKEGGPTLTEAIKKDGVGMAVVSHTQGYTALLTSLTSDLKVAEVNVSKTPAGAWNGAVLRVKTNRAYSSREFSAFSDLAANNKLPEREFLVAGAIPARAVEIFNPATRQWHPLLSPEGRRLAAGIIGSDGVSTAQAFGLAAKKLAEQKDAWGDGQAPRAWADELRGVPDLTTSELPWVKRLRQTMSEEALRKTQEELRRQTVPEAIQAAKRGFAERFVSIRREYDAILRGEKEPPAGVSRERLRLAVEGDPAVGGRVPLNFQTVTQFRKFQAELRAALDSAGIADAVVEQRGSAAWGFKTNPSKPLKQWSPASDVDFAVHSDQALAQARVIGADTPNLKAFHDGKLAMLKNGVEGGKGFYDTPLGLKLKKLAEKWNEEIYGTANPESGGIDFKLNLVTEPFKDGIVVASPAKAPVQ